MGAYARLGDVARVIYAILSDMLDVASRGKRRGKGEVEVPLSRLARLLGLHQNTVRATLRELSSAGLVSERTSEGRATAYSTSEPDSGDGRFHGFYRLPKSLLGRGLSATALVTYAVLSSTADLSAKNGVVDGLGRVVVRRSVKSLATRLGRNARTVRGAFDDLAAAGLIVREETRRGPYLTRLTEPGYAGIPTPAEPDEKRPSAPTENAPRPLQKVHRDPYGKCTATPTESACEPLQKAPRIYTSGDTLGIDSSISDGSTTTLDAQKTGTPEKSGEPAETGEVKTTDGNAGLGDVEAIGALHRSCVADMRAGRGRDRATADDDARAVARLEQANRGSLPGDLESECVASFLRGARNTPVKYPRAYMRAVTRNAIADREANAATRRVCAGISGSLGELLAAAGVSSAEADRLVVVVRHEFAGKARADDRVHESEDYDMEELERILFGDD
jgi:predicted ArsR family transcriptional regulator